ncbi:hypothetical protein D5S17_18660 [Pseudonocardiaceae bacterium YIM PH 21723]|nr:hypothetical protein D5S17_18660 [Pseudonocardiaceae bacterium YIM PH 21723]
MGFRFQIFLVHRASTQPAAYALGPAQVTPISWRFLSSNNRSLGQSADVFTDVESCRDAIHRLQSRLIDSDVYTLRDGRAQWSWSIRIDDLEVAVSTRRYQRRAEAEHASSTFMDLVGQTSVSDELRVVRF